MTTEPTTDRSEAVGLPYLRVYADENGDTQFADEELRLTIQQLWERRVDAVSEPLGPQEVVLQRSLEFDPVGYLHPAPRRQMIIALRGETEIEVTDGSTRRVGPGSIVLMDDADSNGHISRGVGDGDRLFVVLKLPK